MSRRTNILADALVEIINRTSGTYGGWAILSQIAVDALTKAGLDPTRRCAHCGGWASTIGRRRVCDSCRWKKRLVAQNAARSKEVEAVPTALDDITRTIWKSKR
jgi:hypothetical protein